MTLRANQQFSVRETRPLLFLNRADGEFSEVLDGLAAFQVIEQCLENVVKVS